MQGGQAEDEGVEMEPMAQDPSVCAGRGHACTRRAGGVEAAQRASSV